MLLRKTFITLLPAAFCLLPFLLSAQYFDLGQDPSSTRWSQINSPNFKVIYPENYKNRALYTTNLLEQMTKIGDKTMSSDPRKISVILHTKSVLSNAMVPWAPKRMEFYNTPSQSSYAQPWLDQLAIHEYRHVVQISKMRQGFGNGLYYVIGQQANTALMGLFVPFWFIEGDAVCLETAVSYTGRGREPSFVMPLRTQALNYGIYSYDKAYFGSYKDFVPNHYILGYHLVAASRMKWGPILWDTTLNIVAKKAYTLVPFNKGIKSVSGLNKTGLYKEMMTWLDSLWRIQLEKRKYSDYTVLSQKRKRFTDYINPIYLDDSTVLAIKTSIDDIDRFVLLKEGGKEKKIFTPGFYYRETLSKSGDLVVFGAKTYDARWSNRRYAVIRTLNLRTGKTKQLTRQSRYFAPAISNDATKIVVVEFSEVDSTNLVILDSKSGDILNKFASPENDFLMIPVWAENDRDIYVVALNNKGKGLLKINSIDKSIEWLIPYGYTEIYKPFSAGKYIFFSAAYSGIENIYVFDTKTNLIWQVTSSEFGAANPNVSTDLKMLYYSNYTEHGYEIVSAYIDPENWIPLNQISRDDPKLYDSLAKEEDAILSLDYVEEYPEKRYRKWKNLFYFHSWAPVSIDATNQTFNPGVSLLSQNMLSTTFTTLGYEYNLNESTGKFYANLGYYGWYPVFNFTFDIGNRASSYIDKEDVKQRFTWRETNFKTSVSLPLIFTKNRWINGIRPGIATTLIGIKHNSSTPHDFIEGSIQSMDYQFVAYNQIQSSRMDLYPRWGQTIDLNFRNTPFPGHSLGDIFSFEAWLFFPGIVRHHGLRIYYGYQQKNTGEYNFSDLVNYPYGYYNQYNDNVNTISFNYRLPLAYPDWSFVPILYLKRIKAALYYGYAEGVTQGGKTIYQSAALDLTGEMHILRFLSPFDIGLRTIYLPNEEIIKFEFLFSVNFNSFFGNSENNLSEKWLL